MELVILPSDPWSLVGAKGDEALIAATLEELRRYYPDRSPHIVTGTAAASDHARRLGCLPMQIWGGPHSLARVARACGGAKLLVVLGADIMDGFYAPMDAVSRWWLADLTARWGGRSVVVGFSFNDRPSRWLRTPLAKLSARVELRVRDAASLARLERFCGRRADLVADIAFLLEPATGSAEVARVLSWAREEAARGRVVLGFNVHPMLTAGGTRREVRHLIESSVHALNEIRRRRPVSVLLLSHDDRPEKGDRVCLEPIAAALATSGSGGVLLPARPMCAAELKAAAGATDCLMTGRMHLAIAALGQGVPVGAFTYQGKFQGLFQHFGLPESLLVSPDEPDLTAALTAALDRLLADRSVLRARVSTRLASVIELARSNLAAGPAGGTGPGEGRGSP